jgi:membrane protease YdiL (CAAX protease family)
MAAFLFENGPCATLPPMEEAKITLPTQPKKVWLEVGAIWLIAIGIILIFKLLAFVPIIEENLWGIAGLVFLFLPFEYLYRKKQSLADFGFTWKSFPKGLLWALVLAAIIFPLYIPAYQWWFAKSDFNFGLPTDFWKEVVGFFLLVSLPEEFFYRGYMQTRLDQIFKGRLNVLGAKVGWGLVIAAAFFAVGHLVEPRPDKLGTFFPGLVFGWLRARTGSIGGAVVFHALCNIWAQVLRYGYFGVP